MNEKENLQKVENEDSSERKTEKTKTGISKESSSAILGAMIPQIPLTKNMTKGDNPMGIPNELLEFVYNPEATHTVVVEKAFEQTAKDFKTINLPWKVRRLTIERATLRVKIAWLSKLSRYAEGSKITAYKKRLVDVERALRKITSSVDNAEEKARMQAEINKLDKAITSDTKQKIKEKKIVESVQTMVEESVDNGTLPSASLYYLYSEKWREDPVMDEFEYYSEGANWDLHKELKKTKKEVRAIFKTTKRLIKEKKYDEASEEVLKAKKPLESIRKYMESSFEDSSLTTTTIGFILGWLKAFGRAFLVDIVTLNFGQFFASIYEILRLIDGILEHIKSKQAKGKPIDITVANRYYNDTLIVIRKFEKKCDDLSKKIRSLKNEEQGTVKQESVELDAYKTLTAFYEAGYIEDSSYVALYMEAKKPDDGMMAILEKLNKKGYITKYSCSGHKAAFKSDRNDDGIINGKMASGARIMFDGDYNFPDPPKHWGWKSVDGKDYLYVLPISHNAKKQDQEKAYTAWKNKYMPSLDRWVDSLKDVDTTSKIITKKNPKKEEDITESVFDDDFRTIDDMIEDELALFQLESSLDF